MQARPTTPCMCRRATAHAQNHGYVSVTAQPSMYIATLNHDFIAPVDKNGHNRLLNGLTQSGREYSGTLATILIDREVGEILLALEVLARGIPQVGGELGALVRLARRAPEARFHDQALSNPLRCPLPSG